VPKYVVVDSNNYWVTYGEFTSAEDALMDAVKSGNLDNPETLHAFEVLNETIWFESQIKQMAEEDTKDAEG
jgi:hypothetical protein